MRCALVTGASGFVGRYLCRALAERGVEVRALVRKTPMPVNPHVRVIDGDITNPGTLVEVMDGVDTVFHSAALLGPPSLPLAQFRLVNGEGTRNLARAARAAQVERFVHLSSVAVTGGAPSTEPVDEEYSGEPRGPYAATKLEAEAAVKKELSGSVRFVIARPGWVYGADSASTCKLFRLIAAGRMILIGAAENLTQPIAVADLVEGLVRCAVEDAPRDRTFNFVGPESLTTRAMCEAIANSAGVKPPKRTVPMPVARLAAVLCEALWPASGGKLPIDSSKVDFFRLNHAYKWGRAERELGWRPQTDFLAGCASVVRSMRERGELN